MDGLGQVGNREAFGAFKVCDGAGDFEDAIVGAGGEALLLHGTLKEAFSVGAQLAIGADLARGHLRIGVNFFAVLLESLALPLAGYHNAGADLGRALDCRATAKLLVLNGWNFDVDVDAVEQGA